MRTLCARVLTLSVPSLAFLAAPVIAQGTPAEFAEAFALAPDRAAVLGQLVPGTADYYYYRCLQSQHVGAFEDVGPLLATWVERHGRDDRVEEIECRQALLTFARDPQATFTFLRQRLGLRFDAERQRPGARPDLPSRLEPALLSPNELTRLAYVNHPNSLDGFSDSALPGLLAAGVPEPLLRALLQRLSRPDLPNLPDLIARDLRQPRSGGFGSLPIHALLLQSQLDELLRLLPAVLEQPQFVQVYVQRLQPGADVRWQHDERARADYLQRLGTFAERLPPAHNALKVHVLYHRLAHDLAIDQLDKQRFLAYLRLPRRTGYANPDYLRRSRGAEVVAGGHDFPTGLEPVADDEPLVRACFEHFFSREDGYTAYSEFVREDWLRRLFAEVKILAGEGDMERWYSLLDDPAYYERLVQRVEIAFPPTQRRRFLADEPIALDVDVKNVPTLLVKVYRLDAYAWCKEKGKDVDASIDLDGVVANQEQLHEYKEPPLRRVRRRFEFPALTGGGSFVIELVGNGVSSRAVIQRGRLGTLERLTAAGPQLTVVDEAGNPVGGAAVFCAGHEYVADDGGRVQLPFAPEAQQRVLVLRAGELANVEPFLHRAEQYELAAGVLVEREALRQGQQAQLCVRPRLSVHGRPIALELLTEPVLEISARSRDGIASLQTVRGPKWTDGLYVHTIQVPDGLAALAVTLKGKVENLSQGKQIELSSPAVELPVNEIDATSAIACPLLGQDGSGWFLEVRGMNGEPLGGRAVALQLRHRDYTDPVHVVLASDDIGRIALGSLPGITAVTADGLPDGNRTWLLTGARARLPARLGGVAGTTLRVPYTGERQQLDRSVATLIELRGGAPFRDASDALALAGGFVELRQLAAGDYQLWLAEAMVGIDVQVTAGRAQQGWAVGAHRALPIVGTQPLQIARLSSDDATVTIQLANAGADARVLVFATRYQPAYDPFQHFALDGMPQPGAVELPFGESLYAAGRELGDELRYVLERRYATKYPGNMLRRPGALLNPWSPVETASAVGLGGGAGGRFGGRAGRPAATPAELGGHGGGPVRIGPGTFPNLDFLPGAVPILADLRPDAEGRVRVRAAELGDGSFVHVLAFDLDDTVERSLALAGGPVAPRDRRLRTPFDAQAQLAEQRRIEFVVGGGEAVVEDAATAKLQTYATLADVHRLLQSLSDNADLATFAFAVRWHEIGDDERRELYRQHACHELHFFLYRKDRAFFDAVLRPYLTNKAHKTFFDRYLLDEDLAQYLDPAAFARLNLVERILLLQRLPGQAEALRRYVQDRGELLPVDPMAVWRGFEAALRSSDLEAGERAAGRKLLALAEPSADAETLAAAKPQAPAAAPGAPAPARNELRREADKYAEGLEEAEKAKDAVEEQERGNDDFFLGASRKQQEDVSRRRGMRALYRAPDPTRRYVEHDYWHRIKDQEDPDLIAANAFWRDFATAPAGQPFGSAHIAAVAGSFTEAMFALALLDLPFQADPPAVDRDGQRLRVRPATPILLARSEVRAAAPAAAAEPVLVRQNLLRLDDPVTYVGSEQRAKFVTGELLTEVAYGCRVVLTNPSELPRRLSVLLQVPQGALPLQNGFFARSLPVELAPFATTSIDYAFYFPAAGDFAHFPAQVAQEGAFVAGAAATPLRVVATPSAVDTTSWEHVSQEGTTDAVLGYLRDHNLARLDLAKIAWRLRDRGVFGPVIELLRARLHYDHVVWSYALLHGDQQGVREFLRRSDEFVARCGPWLDSPLLAIDPVDLHRYEHAEFEPLLHARAHRIGPWRRIRSDDVVAQWAALVRVLGSRPRLDADDWFAVTYYLLLQDRTAEALASFARIDAAALATRLQYDYLAAYVAFFSDAPEQARAIAERHKDYPVERWRRLFRDVLQQLDEATGQAVAAVDPQDRTQQQTALASTEPGLDVAVAGDTVTIRHQNLDSCELRYHRLDVEFAFSSSPFAQQGIGAVGWVQPSRVDVVALPKEQSQTAVPLPAEFRNANVVVEARAGGLVRRATGLATALAVQTIENYGHVQVRDAASGALLPKVYVKVYARMPGGAVRFHKDGYTDLRGRFDYASISERGTEGAERYALLVLGEDKGAVIREVTPPGQ